MRYASLDNRLLSMNRQRWAGAAAVASGALLVIALLLDWWGYPTLFADPTALPSAARFAAEQIDANGRALEADGFALFESRDILWLATGIAAFAVGLQSLLTQRIAVVLSACLGILALSSVTLVTATLIWPPDFADLAPTSTPPLNFSVDLPLHPEAGIFVALIASFGILASAAVLLFGGEGRHRPQRCRHAFGVSQ